MGLTALLVIHSSGGQKPLLTGSQGLSQGVSHAGLVSGGAGEDLLSRLFRVLAGLGSSS